MIRNKGILTGSILGTIMGIIVFVLGLIEPSFIRDSIILSKIFKLSYLPTYYFIILTSGGNQGLGGLILIFPALLLPIFIYGILGALIGLIIDKIRNKNKK